MHLCRLIICSHHFWVGLLLHPLKSDDWKWSTDKCIYIIKGLLKKSMWKLHCGKIINKHHIFFWKNQLNCFKNQDLTPVYGFCKKEKQTVLQKIVLKIQLRRKILSKNSVHSFLGYLTRPGHINFVRSAYCTYFPGTYLSKNST